MASFARALLRLIFKRKPQEGRIEEGRIHEEQGAHHAGSHVGFGSTTFASTLEGASNVLPHSPRSYLVPEDDRLRLFRLMVGITTSPYLGYSESSPIGTRPAANIGIYARVVYSEQKSKDRYKVFSILINVCYFLQIVVAASITAMGAAGVSHGAVTAFGAINTIIAGLLTFLKGSGLPSRLKYYGNEWRKIREFIEQRERDFSRTNCTLDVYEVVAAVDRMYNNTKQEIEMNTPDSYTSVTSGLRFRNGSHEKVDVTKLEGLATRLNGLTAGIEDKAQHVRDRIHEHGRGVQEDIRGVGETAKGQVEESAAYLDREARERRAQAARAVDQGKNEVLDSKDRIEHTGRQAVRDANETHRTAIGEMRSAASAQMHRAVDKLGHHHDHHDSKHEDEG
ncbi:uncharacterized protein GGS22DRAFT_150735 [Annulohypoxylon maeteangense]|uniref:uncharacterized protein n=1 Tax=Annulohypoxylon maeteangense TaxID=1927788 RepID=UPI002008361B|nr:uncharacterized protein GGS22DRAFT_150735 [Annulohypoxylon maeteangense]KAI0890380.1 hypothetical protein GGS22DRAFT_150735 [Annulohypoxylon maeteangense]